MTPQQYCQQKALHKSSSLYYSLRCVASERRYALITLHALFRELTDITANCRDVQVAVAKFHWWQVEIAQTFANNPRHPVSQALYKVICRYRLSEHYFQEMCAGLMLDLTVSRYATFAQLEDYCKHTRGVLNLLCTQVLGYQCESTLKYAELLGVALHLTELLQELRTHIIHGRIYIPQDELACFNVSENDLRGFRHSEAMQVLFAYQTTRIRAFYHNALQHLGSEDRYSHRSGLVQTRIALATLKEIEADGYQLLQHRIHLPPLRKLWIAWRT